MAGIYIVVAGLYITLSTYIVGWVSVDTDDFALIELTKGLLYVFTTGLVLYFGSIYLLKKIVRQSTEIERQRASILMMDQRASSGLLASAIGHDANNLLGTIKLSIDVLKNQETDEKKTKLLAGLEHVVNELVNLNQRLVKGGESDQPGELKEHCLCDEAKRILDFIDENHPVKKLRIEYTGSTRATAEVNRYLYAQVIVNMLANVARHVGENAQVHLDFRDVDDSIVVEIHDNGPGIEEGDREKIFEPYYSKHPDGAGLGLASVNAIMKLHRGAIGYKPSKLGGACFELKFPKNHVVGDSAPV